VANIPASPTNGQRVEVTNSTGIQGFSPLNGLPAGFTGSTSVKVRLQWNTPVAANWNWIDAFAVNPDGRYVQIANLSSAANSPSTTTGANSAAVKTAKDAADAAQLSANNAQTAANNAQTAANNAAPPGTVVFVARNTAPTGWLKANGALVSRTTFSALFAAIGTTFGAGDGSTTFALPDLRGEFIRSWDDGRGVDSGRGFGTAQADELRAHTHGFNGNGAWIDSGGSFIVNAGGVTVNMTRQTATNSTGGVETRPRNIALLAVIKF
jgi:microcystin-dependent protein